MSDRNKLSRHYQIAIDIARKIKKRELEEGKKLSGRSIAATEYETSTETVRKAFSLLKQYNVIQIKEKSGAIVLSREASVIFLEIFKTESNLKNSLTKLDTLFNKKNDVEKEIRNTIKNLKIQAGKVKFEIPIDYFLLRIHEGFYAIGRTIEDLDINRNTGGTVFGIVSNNKTISNVNSGYIIQEEDVLYISGDYDVSTKTINFIKSGN